MALTIYEGIKDDKLVDENIDEVILRLLGLENINDLDYDTYKTLLKERMMAGRMKSTTIPSEETEKLTNEYKRVKRETGRFKVKKKPIKKDSFTPPDVSRGTRTKRSGKKLGSTPSQKFLPSGSDTSKVEEIQETLSDKKQSSMGVMDFLKNVVSPSLTSIQKSLENILNNNIKEQKAEQKAANTARKAAEKQKSRDKESRFESAAVKKLGDSAKKVLKPVQSIFDTLWNFIKNIGLGIAALKLVEILEDPGKFFRDLGNRIIDALNTVIKTVFDILFWPMNEFIKALNITLDDFEKAINDSIGKLPGVPELKLPDIPIIEAPQIPRIPPPPEPEPMPVPGMAGGGQVDSSTGTKISGMGVDTQLVALQPGEVVMSNKAVDAYGADTLLGMNADAGGTNIPKMGEVPGFNNGGRVGGHMPALFGSSGVPASGSVSVPTIPRSKPIPAQSTPTTPAVPTPAPTPTSSKAGYKSILDLISSVEAPSYDTINGGHINGLSKMTIAGARQAALNAGYGSGAMGRYQQMPQFVLERARSIGLDPNRDLFSPQNQDKLGILLIDQAGYKSWKAGKMSTQKFAYNLAGTWRGLPEGPSGLTFQDQYASGNKAHTSWSKVMNVLGSAGDSQSLGSSQSSSQSSPTGRPNLPPSRTHTENYNFQDVTIPGQSSAPSIRPPMSGSSAGGGTSVVMAGGGGSSRQSSSSFAGGNQSVAPMFSPIDENNPELLVVKSIYNIVG
jgi:hypothetical protein